MEITLAILKPDCVRRKLVGKAIQFIEDNNFTILAMKIVQLDKTKAEAFYSVHKEKPFFGGLVQFMSSGPCIPMVLEKDYAVTEFRDCIGNTDPQKAIDGTLRKMYGSSVQENIVHGSDSDENAKKEIAFFFLMVEIIK